MRSFPKTSWEGVSDWYGSYLSHPGTLQAEVVFPNAERLLMPKTDKRYLDIACGQGAFLQRLAKDHPRARFDGIDASPSLIAQAERNARGSNVHFQLADACRFSHLFPTQAFDGATCILAIQNIDSMEPMLQNAARVLKPGAALVIVMNHPAFRQPRQSGWGWDEKRKLQYRRVDRYLSSYEMPILAHPGSDPKAKTYSYHRPLQVYVTLLAKYGFMLNALEEWPSNRTSDSGPKAKAENIARQEIPMFLALRAVRS